MDPGDCPETCVHVVVTQSQTVVVFFDVDKKSGGKYEMPRARLRRTTACACAEATKVAENPRIEFLRFPN